MPEARRTHAVTPEPVGAVGDVLGRLRLENHEILEICPSLSLLHIEHIMIAFKQVGMILLHSMQFALSTNAARKPALSDSRTSLMAQYISWVTCMLGLNSFF